MKYKILAFGLLLSFTACNREAPADNETATEETTNSEEQAVVAAKVDPVCNMTYDASWDQYVVADGDTTWFCSETCKTAFLGNPAKYNKAAHEAHDDHEGHQH